MAAFSASQSGPWSEAATWGGGGVPGDGDTATIGSSYTVTIDTDVTIGTGSGNAIVVSSSTASVVQNASTTLTVKGSVVVQGVWHGLAGHTFRWINTSGGNLGFKFTPAWNASAPYIMLGESGSSTRSTWEPGSGSTDPFFFETTTGVGHPQDWRFYNVDFTDLYDGSNRLFFAFTLNGAYRDRFIAKGCTFDGCGGIAPAMDANATFEVENTTFSNERASEGWWFNMSEVFASGSRIIRGNVFNKAPSIRNPGEGAIIEDNIFQNGFTTVWTQTEKPDSWGRNFVNHGGANITIEADITDDYWLCQSGTNVHGPNTLTRDYSGVTGHTVHGVIAEYTSTDDQGDFILLGTGAGTLTVENCIMLKNSNNSSWGTIVTGLGDAQINLIARNNSGFIRNGSLSTDRELFRVGETSYLNSFICQSNLAVTDVTSAPVHIARDQTGSSAITSDANLNYNCGYNITDGAELSTKYSNFSGLTSPGANDVAANPGLADIDVGIAAWDAANGGPGTISNAITEMAKRNLSTFNPDYSLTSLREFVEAGWTPSNAALQGTSHDGNDIGAIPVQLAAAGGYMNMLTMGVG